MVLVLTYGQAVPKWIDTTIFDIVFLKLITPNPLGVAIWEHHGLGRITKRVGGNCLFAPVHIRPLNIPCPVVTYVHDMMYHLRPCDWTFWDQLYMRIFFYLSTTKSKHIVVNSKSTKADVLRLSHIAPDRVSCVYPGLPIFIHKWLNLDDSESSDIEAKISCHKPYVLWVGSNHPRKNLRATVKMFEKIANRVPHSLLLVGPEFGIQKIDIQAEFPEICHRVLHMGLVDEMTLAAIYEHSSLLLFSSLYEGFGFPLLEALCLGSPVVAFNVSSIPEVVQNAAILIEAYDYDKMGNAVVELIEDDLRRKKLALSGRELATSYSWVKCANKILGIMESSSVQQ
jgi:glycosyltransferase involved in cell wall biosynthesis